MTFIPQERRNNVDRSKINFNSNTNTNNQTSNQKESTKTNNTTSFSNFLPPFQQTTRKPYHSRPPPIPPIFRSNKDTYISPEPNNNGAAFLLNSSDTKPVEKNFIKVIPEKEKENEQQIKSISFSHQNDQTTTQNPAIISPTPPNLRPVDKTYINPITEQKTETKNSPPKPLNSPQHQNGRIFEVSPSSSDKESPTYNFGYPETLYTNLKNQYDSKDQIRSQNQTPSKGKKKTPNRTQSSPGWRYEVRLDQESNSSPIEKVTSKNSPQTLKKEEQEKSDRKSPTPPQSQTKYNSPSKVKSEISPKRASPVREASPIQTQIEKKELSPVLPQKVKNTSTSKKVTDIDQNKYKKSSIKSEKDKHNHKDKEKSNSKDKNKSKDKDKSKSKKDDKKYCRRTPTPDFHVSKRSPRIQNKNQKGIKRFFTFKWFLILLFVILFILVFIL